MSLPLVSVLIPTYNRAHLIGESIQSVLAQSHTNLEVIVLDNNSTDNTEEVVKTLNDGRIRYYRNSQNIGMNPNFDKAVELVQGAYFCWLGSDDMQLPEYVEKCVAMFDREPDVSLVYTRFQWLLGNTGERQEPQCRKFPSPGIHDSSEALAAYVTFSNIGLRLNCALIRTDFYRAMGLRFLPYNHPDVMMRLEMFVRMQKFGFVDEVLFLGRLHEGRNKSDNAKHKRINPNVETLLLTSRFLTENTIALHSRSIDLFKARRAVLKYGLSLMGGSLSRFEQTIIIKIVLKQMTEYLLAPLCLLTSVLLRGVVLLRRCCR